MNSQTPKKKSWLKRFLIGAIILLLAGGAIYWYVATEKFADTADRKAAYTVNALDFIREFQQNDSAANEKYADRIVTVSGIVSEVEAADTTINIKFIEPVSGSYAIFAFQEQHLNEARAIKAGDHIAIKGSCSGGIYSEILGTQSITFKRCALTK